MNLAGQTLIDFCDYLLGPGVETQLEVPLQIIVVRVIFQKSRQF